MFWRRKKDEPLEAPLQEPAAPEEPGPARATALIPEAAGPTDAGTMQPAQPGPASAPADLPATPAEPPAAAPAAGAPPPLTGWEALAAELAAKEAVRRGRAQPPVEEAATGPSIATGVQASRRGFMARLHGILGRGDDEETWEEVEETLIAGDVGARLAMDVVAHARERRDASGPEAAVRRELEALLPPPTEEPWRPARPTPEIPAVVLVVGVNGTGKTTSIAKLAARFRDQGDTVLLAAADTFRAAAIEQLEHWATRVGVPVVAHKAGADPSAVVYDALDAATSRGIDVVIVDTAGRLHTKHNLMEELAKIRRTIDRRIPGARPEVLFVLDATTGQNGLAQAKAFHEASGLTGVILTKLDSTAKGGIVFAIEQALGVPVLFAGVGERLEDLVEFEPDEFVEALFA